MRILLILLAVLLIAFGLICPAYAGGGHYQPGYANIRDFVSPPEKGVVVLMYNPFYWSGEYRNDDGRKLQPLGASRSLNVKEMFTIDLTAQADIDVDIFSYATNPLIFYFSDIKILGAKYAAGIAPSYNYIYTKLDVDLGGSIAVNGTTIASANRHIKMEDSDSGFGDMMARPIMLDWTGEHYDAVFAYSFYAPTGHYAENKLANVGLGYWSHELSLGGLYYPNKNRTTAILFNATYELNTRMSGSDVYPGQNVILEYGVDHFFNKYLEVGVSGSSYFQVTEDFGSAAKNKSNKMMAHAVGGEVDLWIIPGKMSVVGRYFYQYYAQNDLKGQGANGTVRIIF
jgi:hypothetical protein